MVLCVGVHSSCVSRYTQGDSLETQLLCSSGVVTYCGRKNIVMMHKHIYRQEVDEQLFLPVQYPSISLQIEWGQLKSPPTIQIMDENHPWRITSMNGRER